MAQCRHLSLLLDSDQALDMGSAVRYSTIRNSAGWTASYLGSEVQDLAHTTLSPSDFRPFDKDLDIVSDLARSEAIAGFGLAVENKTRP